MTDRDHLAAAALTGLLAVMRDESMAELCESAYDWADAMLCVRGVTEPMPKEKQAEVSDAEPVAWTNVDAAGISRQGTGDTPDSQPTLAQGSVRGECTERDPCPYATGTMTRYCTLTPFTLTDAEREALEQEVELAEYQQRHELVATLRGLLERLG